MSEVLRLREALVGKNLRDRRLRNDMVKRMGKRQKLLRKQGLAESAREQNGANQQWETGALTGQVHPMADGKS